MPKRLPFQQATQMQQSQLFPAAAEALGTLAPAGQSSALHPALDHVLEQTVQQVAETFSMERKQPHRAIDTEVSLRLAMRAMAPRRIAVEGPLRVGKSTLARLLAERMGACHVAEPEENPFLNRFYAGEPGMAFAAQMWFLRERIAQLKAAATLSGPVVSDYILEKDKLFAFLNLSDTELAIYKDFYAANAVASRPDLVVYLQASPAVLTERRRRKGLAAEQGIGEEYTAQVCEAYEHFFSRYSASRLLVVDTSAIDFVNSDREREMLLDRILSPVHGREHFAPLAQIA